MSDVPPPEIILIEKHLPFELVENILSRLPVKTLKRFRAVEKSWRRLIDSEEFAKKHLQLSLASNSNRNLISGFLGFYWLSVNKLQHAQSINLEFEYDTTDPHAISNSCNGLVVVTREPELPILFNPFSREFKVLPVCPIDFPASSSCKTTYGFGYDSKRDDYKVVKAMLFEKPEYCYSEEWIYSLRSDCWRRTAGTSYQRAKWPIHVNGALHTLVEKSGSGTGIGVMGKIIRAFSVETEEDYEVAMPEAARIDTKDLDNVLLDVFDGHLAFVCVYKESGSEEESGLCRRFGVWVMEEYGVKESWVPRLSFGVEKDGFIHPLVYIDGRDKILVNYSCRMLILLGVTQKSQQRFRMPFSFLPALCVETLISPHGWRENGSAEKLKKERDEFLSSGFGFKLAL